MFALWVQSATFRIAGMYPACAVYRMAYREQVQVHCCFTTTETVRTMRGRGALDGHLNFHTALSRTSSRFTSTEIIRTIRDGEPRTATSTSTQLCREQVQCCFTSTETIRTISDGEPRTATSTFTQLLSSVANKAASWVKPAENSGEKWAWPCMYSRVTSQSKEAALPRDTLYNDGDFTTRCKCLLQGERKGTSTVNITGLITRFRLNQTLVVVNKCTRRHGN